MLVVVAVAAQVFPIAAVGRVIVVVAVLMVDRQLVQGGVIELAAALGADRAMDLQRFCAVVAVTVHLSTHPLDQLICLFNAGQGYSSGPS